MKIVIFSGTTEGRELSYRLAEQGAEVVVSVATEYGSEEQGRRPGITTLTGRLAVDGMKKLLSDAELCVDATHPYAVQVTRDLRAACGEAGIEYRRLIRRGSGRTEGSGIAVETAAEAAALLADQPGNILLTTGAKELNHFQKLAPARLYPRILPTHEGLSACEQLGIPHRNIIAMQGPFSQELNEAVIRQYQITWLVTKDGGIPGGFPEKAQAAAATGTKLVVIRRPEETGETFEKILAHCIQKIQQTAKTSAL
ncbi:MAG: precorrin-6A reductase [Oscillospiraceae bacterium]|nr:precorrin-6A reductase [Oscillospiraceae bacterium]